MNLLLFSAADLGAPGQLQISDERLQHLHNVHRAAVGDSIRVGEIGGHMGEGRIAELSAARAIITFQLDCPPPAKLPVILLVALPRPKMLRRILRSAAEFGVEQLVLFNSYRVEKSFWQTPVLNDSTLRSYLLQGLEQSRDTMLPPVTLERRFKPFVEDRLPGLLQNRRGLLAHPAPTAAAAPDHANTPLLLAIGPEGGFIPYEVEMLQKAGLETVSLGPRILRVENAVTALLGRLLSPGC
ncbi:16S rRNA (uracil(1498)-N(3))-methyltransferase [Parahaliea aestuarii]|uniref:Ribosomal RNA small subunit methyltransferase E n=1 Tax=Parahaliea aestuarii TaxID=1852021 RepID=A0A5C9A2R9_9GAMM|nr:16S rRNA (uracil(1498)-N(3))-methyltransferase [Parahaliea aestuarii]TXS95016.1 16S rRNA (uracil(1498)-N(3))-methyltransferase [Parahaliea aestuarii]